MDLNRPHLGVGDALERRHSDPAVPKSNQMALGMDFPHPHYAMIYLDHNGELQVKASASIAGCGGAIFTPEVADHFVKLAAPAPVANMQFQPSPSQVTALQPYGVQPSTAMVHAGQAGPTELIPCQFLDHNKRRRRDTKRTITAQSRPKSTSPSPTPRPGRTILRVGNRDLLRRYYEKAFEDFQQLNCRAIAKSYIKLVEPRKQVHYPYNGRKVIAGVSQRVDPEQTKPGWWPVGVLHREPDHLLKRDRLRLLVHILCELKNSHGVTADKLRDAGQDVRRQITPANRLQVLDEIYFVRQMEERYLDGKIDANALLQVTQTHLPEAICQDDELSSSIHTAPITAFDEDLDGPEEGDEHHLPTDESAPSIYPASQGMPMPLSPTTSDSSGPRSPTFGAYPIHMSPNMLPQESPSAAKHIPAEPNYLPGYYGQQFMPTEKTAPAYWPGVPHMSHVTQFGY
ncbi:uncharacterized protein N7482_009849 [Penicillium canariense]|uniref:Subtelomeric hrmA-associated cluster protein AFUB-079030/YDR124W-like helical bundle domain-containing protein n=1 Tax=Penicillium canariense TaxID=189055 RepID=A0A9W9HPI6_9EURO|nr:uncharacterized protein N7482_009849 [Penicillium canariense]KAJ5153371.1 hypothetical protein N7482_009849 [Penicillium canariense]